jgi:Ca2+-transporting ATPase
MKKSVGTGAIIEEDPIQASNPRGGEREGALFAREIADVLQTLEVDLERGLDREEVERRRAQYGANLLQMIRPRPAWRIFLNQFASLIVGLLAGAAAIAWATGDSLEAVAILIVLLLNALVGFATEWKAEQALDALRRQSQATARVCREGRESIIDAVDLVPGDILILNAGDRAPADARLLETANLRVEESALTGESTTVEKSPGPVAPGALLAERSSMIYLGTSIAGGRAIAVVTAIGAATELGRIGRLVAEAPIESTPLERRLDQLGRRLVYVVLGISILVMVTGWLRGDGLWMMAEVAISLAVAAVPEGLPAVTTFILALGVLRMARQRAIIRRLPAVETLGSVTIICSDKTGTLTENRMTVREFRLANGERKTIGNAAGEKDKLFLGAIRTCVLCNEASIEQGANNGADMQAIGDPTETALLVGAESLGVGVGELRRQYPKLAEEPFDAATKRMITIHRTPDGKRIAAMKGGPSAVLAVCDLDDRMRFDFTRLNEEMADEALRVLALAEKQIQDEASENSSELRATSGYRFLGLVGMIDPPRAEARGAIEKAHAAGIRVVMLTGDQINTARAIARELRLSGEKEPRAIHARDLEGADHRRVAELARSVDVFARVSPEDKLRIVAALQGQDEIVAVTGDGVNDAPALKRADIGVAMGMRGTEVAKEAADVVLADDNFATILKAVEGGRAIYANIHKFVHLMFSENLAEVLVIFSSLVIGWPLPLLPLQILWVNLVTDVFPALALSVEPGSPDAMRRPPSSPQAALLSTRFFILILWQSAMLAGITLCCYWWALREYGAGAHARTIALLALVGVQLGHTFNCRSRTRSALEGLSRNPYLWIASAVVIALQLSAIYFRPLGDVLETAPINGSDWTVAGISIVAPIMIVEATKLLSRRKESPG